MVHASSLEKLQTWLVPVQIGVPYFNQPPWRANKRWMKLKVSNMRAKLEYNALWEACELLSVCTRVRTIILIKNGLRTQVHMHTNYLLEPNLQ